MKRSTSSSWVAERAIREPWLSRKFNERYVVTGKAKDWDKMNEGVALKVKTYWTIGKDELEIFWIIRNLSLRIGLVSRSKWNSETFCYWRDKVFPLAWYSLNVMSIGCGKVFCFFGALYWKAMVEVHDRRAVLEERYSLLEEIMRWNKMRTLVGCVGLKWKRDGVLKVTLIEVIPEQWYRYGR